MANTQHLLTVKQDSTGALRLNELKPVALLPGSFCTDSKYNHTWESKAVVLASGMFYFSTMGGCGPENLALMLGCGPKTTFSVPKTQHNSSQNAEEFRTGVVSLKEKNPELQKQIFIQLVHWRALNRKPRHLLISADLTCGTLAQFHAERAGWECGSYHVWLFSFNEPRL